MKTTFKEYLKIIHSEIQKDHKDDSKKVPEDLQDWIDSLSSYSLIDYADLWEYEKNRDNK